MEPGPDPETLVETHRVETARDALGTRMDAAGRRPGPRRAVPILTVALLLAATVAVALTVRPAVPHEVQPDRSPSTAPGPTLIAAGPSASAPSPGASASPSPSHGPLPSAEPVSFPASSGSAWIGAGPSGDVWVLTDHDGGSAADPVSVSILALVDTSGRPQPGWPIALAGWRCAADAPPRMLPVAADGSIRLVCAEDTASEGPQRHVGFAFDRAGQSLSGWPVELPDTGLTNSAVVVGDELRLVASEIASTEGSTSEAQPAAWWLVGVEATGEVRIGQRSAVADADGSFDVRLASDGNAYRLAFGGGPGAVQTVITAIDFAGNRSGWPVTVDGFASFPVVGPDGRLVLVTELGEGADARAQTMSIDPSGGPAIATSDGLPIAPLEDRTGAGAVVMSPLVGADGAVYVFGRDASGQRIFVVNPAVAREVPPPRLAKPLQSMGVCSEQDTGCGVWRTVPVVGPDGILLVAESAVGDGGGLAASAGGSVVAIASDGTSPAGWPIILPDPMAGYWSLLSRADGTVDALAVVPTDAGDEWTLVVIGADGKPLGSSLIILP